MDPRLRGDDGVENLSHAMRILFLSRRFFPAISDMSIYAFNLLRQPVAQGHGVPMISQFYGTPERNVVYGGGPPPPVPA